MKSLLAFAGRHGPALLFAGVLLGSAWPGLAAAMKPARGAAVLLFTLGAFLKVDAAALHESLRRPGRYAVTLLWIIVGVPLIGVAVTALLPLPEGIRFGVLLSVLAPPVGSAAAIATMLGLDAALALTMTVVASVLSPLYLPLLIGELGGQGGQTTAALSVGLISGNRNVTLIWVAVARWL